jgi:hypothetical protein
MPISFFSATGAGSANASLSFAAAVPAVGGPSWARRRASSDLAPGGARHGTSISLVRASRLIVDRGRPCHRPPLAALWRVSLSFREAALGSRAAALHSIDPARSSEDAAPKCEDGAPEFEDSTLEGKEGVLSFRDAALAHGDASHHLGLRVGWIEDAALNSRDAGRSFRHAALKDEDRAPKLKDGNSAPRCGSLAIPNGTPS